MTNPVYKIETYTGAVLDHTITDEALSVYSKEIVTDAVGNFSFVVPTKKNGSSYYYDDIALHDKVKIWYGYDSVSGNPDFVGRVGKITAPLSTASGYTRQISGLSQGEVLVRRFKENKFYTGTNASVIVTEWANDLGLGTGEITADTNQPDIEVRTKSYFDLLRFISDFWISSGVLIQKDFFVNYNNDLVWKVRPLRTAGVETFTVGDNIIHYVVSESVSDVKNDVVVYGSADKPRPLNKDLYTDSLASWTISVGDSLALDNATKQAGTYSIRAWTGAGAATVTFKRDIPRITIRDINKLFFWSATTPDPPSSSKVRLHAPDSGNYFEADFNTGAWTFNTLNLGPDYEYDAVENPNGVWSKTGTPNWWDIEYVEFTVTWAGNNEFVFIDGLWFYPDRWTYNSSDATSINAYGRRNFEVTDDKLHTDNDCQKRATIMKFQMKDPPKHILLTVPGNTNVLVGDRLSMTIPAEGISAVNFDVYSVEHSFSNNGFITKASMVNNVYIRQLPSMSPMQKLMGLNRAVRHLNLEERGFS